MSELMFYRDGDDYLAIPPGQTQRFGCVEGRAPAVSGLPSSVCTVTIAWEYLRDSTRVERSAVPAEWLAALDPA